MNITCPTSGMNVLIAGPSPGGICVCGTGNVQDGSCVTPVQVRVRVLAGSVSQLPPADPMQPGDLDVPVVDQKWSAAGVSVPGSGGAPITVVAWEQAGTSGWGTPVSVWCNAGGSGATSCCG